ncbi:MAG: hypothetical protein M3457_20605 [Chloroflexota bacterium]|nr:hypothetical protein [Chloroflexota bacterium]
MTRFDASAWIGQWPFTASVSTGLTDLVGGLGELGLSGAAVSPLAAVLGPEPMTANRALIEDIYSLPGGFAVRVVPILDPSLPGWERDLDDLLSRHAASIGAFRIVPNYHGFAVDGAESIAVARAVTNAGLGLCVQIRMLDERAHHPLMKVPGVPLDGVVRLSDAVPDARIMAGGIFQPELAMIRGAPRISAELSSIESGDTVANAAAVIGIDRLMLGTHVPVYDPAPAVAKVAVLDDETAVRITQSNATTFFHSSSIRGEITS